DVRQRVGDQREIQPVEERDEAGQDQQPSMEGCEVEPLQELTDIQDGTVTRAGPRHSRIAHSAYPPVRPSALRPFGSVLAISPACLTANPPGTKRPVAPQPERARHARRRSHTGPSGLVLATSSATNRVSQAAELLTPICWR